MVYRRGAARSNTGVAAWSNAGVAAQSNAGVAAWSNVGVALQTNRSSSSDTGLQSTSGTKCDVLELRRPDLLDRINRLRRGVDTAYTCWESSPPSSKIVTLDQTRFNASVGVPTDAG
uniref:Uncharacterized protein n=1 Tax=Timema genevievae TaxID=629358 RepID=A0A7R9JPA4_TIMGE|nr:unnamed protein product [Timema genevievae]